jgi:hypothetical protein
MDTAKPVGIGLSVAFIWALAAQMLTSVFLVLFFGTQGFNASRGRTGTDFVFALGYLSAMVVLIIIGEALRSGRRWSWWLMVVLAVGLTLGGLVLIPSTIDTLTHGDAWALWAQVIILTLPPYILYRLLQPGTRQWYAHVSPVAARARHSAPKWLATIIGCAVAGGVLTAMFERL